MGAYSPISEMVTSHRPRRFTRVGTDKPVTVGIGIDALAVMTGAPIAEAFEKECVGIDALAVTDDGATLPTPCTSGSSTDVDAAAVAPESFGARMNVGAGTMAIAIAGMAATEFIPTAVAGGLEAVAMAGAGMLMLAGTLPEMLGCGTEPAARTGAGMLTDAVVRTVGIGIAAIAAMTGACTVDSTTTACCGTVADPVTICAAMD